MKNESVTGILFFDSQCSTNTRWFIITSTQHFLLLWPGNLCVYELHID